MDDQNKNLILATALSFLVILVWFVLFPPPETPQTRDPSTFEAVPANGQNGAVSEDIASAPTALDSAATGAPTAHPLGL